MLKISISIAILYHLLSEVYAVKIQPLTGQWILNDTAGNYHNLKVSIPGGIYTDLERNGVIQNVFYEDNDVATRWVAKNNWTYFKSFIIQEADLQFNHVNLVFEGIDTFSTVYINDEQVGVTKNMFVQYTFDVKDKLHTGVNYITVKLESPVTKAQELYNKQVKKYEVKPKCVPDYYRGECHVNHIRKMQASFAWDWGPAFPSMGIWKNVYLEMFNSSNIRYINVNTALDDNSKDWTVYVKTYLEGVNNFNTKNDTITIRFTVAGYDTVMIYPLNITKDVNDNSVYDFQNFTVSSARVELWWPNGYGKQNLYNLSVSYNSGNYVEKSSKKIQIGFRTITLNQEELESGRAFYFTVNNVNIFAKGSNIIPLNILPERGQNSSTIKYLLQSAKEAHFNMLRVWGGGVYESEEFYRAADELGILIWQDFMFACSMYPSTEIFLENVKDEVLHQVRRLQHHASIAIWAGNNENEAALRQNWYGTILNFTLYKNDYVKLYVDTIKTIVNEADDTRHFLVSSPTNGVESELEGHIASNPQDEKYGDVHFYNYIVDGWLANVYPIPRFASEYGYQSLPSLKSLMTITNSISNLHINGTLLQNRQHHQFGYIEMALLGGYRLKYPNNKTDPIKYLYAMVYYGQIIQAMSIKIETEHYRRYKGLYNNDNKGNTMGALYWQLNDVWVAPTWSGIDYNLNWKMMHYFAKSFFAPLIITYELSLTHDLRLFVVNDHPGTFYNLTVKVDVYNWNNMTALYTQNYSVPVLTMDKAELASSFWLDKYLIDAKCGDISTAKNNCFMYLSLLDSSGEMIAPVNYVFPVALKNANLLKPKITLKEIHQIDEYTYEIEIASDGVALFVWLETQTIKGRFSDNGFLQIRNSHIVHFYAESKTSDKSLAGDLTIVNLLYDTFIEK